MGSFSLLSILMKQLERLKEIILPSQNQLKEECQQPAMMHV